MTAESIKTNGEGFKHTFTTTEGANVIDSPEVIINHLLEMKNKYVLLNNGGTRLNLEGTVGETGLIVTDGHGRIVAGVKHPSITPVTSDTSKNQVEFGGETDTSHIEPILETPIGVDKAAIYARLILQPLRENIPVSLVADNMSGVLRIGSEPEAWLIKPDNGDLAPVSGGELQLGLLEETLNPIVDPDHFLKTRAKYNLNREKRHPGLYISDLSVIPTSSPDKISINTGHELGAYVFAIQHWLRSEYFNFSDPQAEALMDSLAQSTNFENHQDLMDKMGHMGHWVNAASHGSLGMNHLREGISAMYTPTEAAIAIADIFNSDLATVAEFLMFSTPIIFNQTPKVDGQWPRDYRSILRYLMDTSNPAPFIRDTQTMYDRIKDCIINGRSHTIDRSSYVADVNGKAVPVMHGRVRNRPASHEPGNQTGRIEFTGCSNSPSILDEQARNAFIQILAVAALEAVENQKHPIEHLGEKFPHLTTWNKQKNLSIKASLFGFDHPEVRPIISEALALIDHVKLAYPSLNQLADIASDRIQNLLQPAVESIGEYLHNPQGPISEVLQNEINRGASGLDIARKVHNYQIEVSKLILANL